MKPRKVPPPVRRPSPSAARSIPAPDAGVSSDPRWYLDAILYEVRVRSFFDSNGDGFGDFEGLRSKLGYLQDLGVTALWLLPFYPSPGRDDGYDIADYCGVHPDVGTIDDFRRFLDEAHERGLRVITELVLNHTSDQHPWFQAARRAPPGSPERSRYVFSDDPTRYAEARIIFQDFEESNWTWDPLAKAYFWHRFFSHQPDLNFDDERTQAALLQVVDFWLRFGVDGLRLDAVPYLYERQGTICENLPETHQFLKRLRAHVDAAFPGRMLLAEANQWPEEAALYLGKGDECHMAFHFPLMPRMYMAVHQEERFPITDILSETPAIPDGAQWATFLRNHDELTLEMVTEEERDTLLRAYAREPAMRLNLGIRRRLAPLVGGDRSKMELLVSLLLSLPGTPALYYGDEIGMGDNVYLSDRNGLRTPMQWSAEKNAGFSTANPQQLVLPVIVDPAFHYSFVNVEVQEANPSSLLWWTKRLLERRKRSVALGRGAVRLLHDSHPSILAFLRTYGEERVLVVANLSHFVQCATLDLKEYAGLVPIELQGRTRLPPLQAKPLSVTLAGYGFYWFDLCSEEASTSRQSPETFSRSAPRFSLPVGAMGSNETLVSSLPLAALGAAVTRWMRAQVWFPSGATNPAEDSAFDYRSEILDILPIGSGVRGLYVIVLSLERPNESAERWALVFQLVEGEALVAMRQESGASLVCELISEYGEARGLVDAFAHPGLFASLLQELRTGTLASGQAFQLHGELWGRPRGTESIVHGANSLRPLIVVDESVALRMWRQLDEATTPELELGRRLQAQEGPLGIVPMLGSLELVGHRGQRHTLAVARVQQESEGTALDIAWIELARYSEWILATAVDGPQGSPQPRGPGPWLGSNPDHLSEVSPLWLERMRSMGTQLGELHKALAATEPSLVKMTRSDARARVQQLRNLAGRALRFLRARLERLPSAEAARAAEVVEALPLLHQKCGELLEVMPGLLRIRCHGHYRLEGLLNTGKNLLILSMEGDPRRSFAHRRRRSSPLSDVASMLSSLQTTARAFLVGDKVRVLDRPRLESALASWVATSATSFYSAWVQSVEGAQLLPSAAQAKVVIDSFLLELALLDLEEALGGEGAPASGELEPLIRLESLLSLQGEAALHLPAA